MAKWHGASSGGRGQGEVAALCSKLTTMNVSDLFYDLLLILIVFSLPWIYYTAI